MERKIEQMKRCKRVTTARLSIAIFSTLKLADHWQGNLFDQSLVMRSATAAQIHHTSMHRGQAQVQRNDRTQSGQNRVGNEIRSLSCVGIVAIDIANLLEDFIEDVF